MPSHRVTVDPVADPLKPLLDTLPGISMVIGQLGQSLDGRIATVSGESRWINGEGALDHLHRLRAAVDAVIVGVGTVVTDDPRLDVRRVPGRNPARVVLDPRGRLPADSLCLRDDGTRRIVIRLAGGDCCPGVEEIVLEERSGMIPPQAVVAALQERGLSRILVEGGSRTISSFIDAGCVDRLHVLVAPVIIGSGKPGLELVPNPVLAQALRPATAIHLLGGTDVLFDCDLRQVRGG